MQECPSVRDTQNCVIYARYSSHAQRDASIEQQVAECEEYAQRLGLKVVKVYADRHLTGTNDSRPQFQAMLKDAAHGRWGYVVTWKVDRFARNRYDSATYKYRLKKYGVQVLYAKESIPPGPEGILLESVLEGSAEYYSANLAQNVRRGMRYNALDCKVNSGAIPFGYQKGPDGRFAVVEAEAEIVREIYGRVADGQTFALIMDDLNRRGLLTKKGRPWSRSSFHRLITNEAYVGVYRFGDVRVEGGMPEIVDRALFLQVQDHLKTKRNPQGRIRENGEYLLTGKLFCGLCGSPMVGVAGTGRTGHVRRYYVCQGRRLEHSCKKENVRRSAIEWAVAEAAYNFILQPDAIDWMADAVMEFQEREAGTPALAALRAELQEVERARGNVMKAIEAGILTPTTKDRLLELEAEAARLQDAIYLEEVSHPKMDRGFMVFWLEQFRAGNLQDPAFRRKLIDYFVAAVYLTDDRLRIVFNYSGAHNEITLGLVLASEAEGGEGPYGSYKCPAWSTKWTLDEHLLFQGRLCRYGVALMSNKKAEVKTFSLGLRFTMFIQSLPVMPLCSSCQRANSLCPCSLS